MARIIIGNQNFIAGAASSPYSVDGGFSPTLKNHNIDYEKGAIYPTDTMSKVGDFTAGYNGALDIVSVG